MMNKRKIGLLIGLLFAIWAGSAQQIVSLDEAIKLALQNSYGLEIARGEQEISALNNDFGNAGFLPQIKATTNNNWSNSTIHQETNLGQITDRSNIAGSGLNASVGLTWTLFDGAKMFVTHRKLNELEKLSQFQYQMAVEELVYRVITQYYGLVKIKQQISLSQSLLTVSEKRKQVAEAKSQAGSSSGLEALQALADYNAQNAALLRLQSQYLQAQYTFARLVTNNPQTIIPINDTITLAPLQDLEMLRSTLKQQNVPIKAASLNLNVYDFLLQEARSAYYPKVGFGVNYNFAGADNVAGYIVNSQTYGLNYGFSASWSLFDGLAVKRSVKSAKIRQKMMQRTFDELNLQMEANLLSQFKLYETNLQIVTLELQNIEVAQKVLTVALEKYALGVLNDIQLKDAQKTFEDAQLRLIQSRYEVKISETELLRLQGLLIR